MLALALALLAQAGRDDDVVAAAGAHLALARDAVHAVAYENRRVVEVAVDEHVGDGGLCTCPCGRTGAPSSPAWWRLFASTLSATC